MAGKLAQLLDPARITLDIRSSESSDALREVAGLLEGHPDVTDFPGFYRDLLARERLDSTCLGNEIALPHARTENVSRIVMAIGRSSQGVLFENGMQTVRLMFVLGTPTSDPGGYLQLLSVLCRIFKDSSNRAALQAAATPEDFVEAMLAAEARLLTPAQGAAPVRTPTL
jgi:mannitol/fructose-specific phosphotransferase system IIA component (Ntr-type)